MASVSNLSVPHSQDNPAPTLFNVDLHGRETVVQHQESRAARADSFVRLAAGLLLGFSGAYILRSPLTFGQIAIIAAFGILLLAEGIFRRVLTTRSPKRPTGVQSHCASRRGC
jgi:uncharacterized membrane protein HdeD (DUF308 family)